MAVGDSALISPLSYLAIGRETATGTYNTCTANLDFLSSSLKVQKDSKILEQIERSRTFSKSISLGKSVGGDVEFYFAPEVTACAWFLENAFGNTVTSATSTGETTGAGAASAMDHTFEVGNFAQTLPSLCINTRKGQETVGRVFEYSGVKVNEISFAAELDDALKCNVSLIGMNATLTTNSIASALTVTSAKPFTFNEGRLSVATTYAALATATIWEVQSVNFKLSNSLKDGSESRRIGTDILDVLPAGIQSYELSCQMRFNTSTAFDAMIAGTELAAAFEFIGTDTMTGSKLTPALTFNFQKIKVKDAGDPEIGGPDEVLTSNVVFDVLRSESATGYAVKAILRNQMASL